MTAGFATAAPPLPFVGSVEETPGGERFVFEVSTPALLLSSSPDGATLVRLEGFASRDDRAGAPDLPRHVVRVAIPFGVTPRLEVTAVREDVLRGREPRAVGRELAEMEPDGNVSRRRIFERDPSLFAGTKRYPSEVAWIREEGIYRDQRYVDVVLAPVRFDPAVKGIRVARTYRVAVVFDGTAATGATASPADPRLEDTYRGMFLNYGQGLTFRGAPELEATERSSVAPALLVGPRYRIRIRANGIVRLDAARLAGTGFDTQPLASYKLTNRGVEVPLQVFDQDGDGNFDPADWVQFYGQALDTEPKAVLSPTVPASFGIFEARDFSDENVYFLEVEAGSRSRIGTRAAAPDNSAIATSFDAVAHLETDDTWRPLAGNDPWYWKPLNSMPVEGTAVTSRTQAVPLPGLASATQPARVVVKLRGITEDGPTPSDHKSRITFKNQSGQTLATQDDDGTWDGRTVFTHDFTWTFPGSGATLTQPAQVVIEARAVSGSVNYMNQFYLDFVEVTYKRTFAAASDKLRFDWPDGSQEFQVTGLTTNTPEVWEVTGQVGGSGVAAPVRLTGGTISGGAGNFAVRFHVANDPSIPDGTLRRFVVTAAGGIPGVAPADFTADAVSDLRNTGNQADLIVITHPTTVGAASTTTLNQFLAWKLANQGITSKVVAIQDVYDEFGDGNPGPLAIKNFLSFVMSAPGWSSPKPAYVLLLGDGTYDYMHKDLSLPDGNFIPTQIVFKDDPSFGYYASDSVLAAVAGGDATPDLVVGRISTRTDAETQAVLQKLLTYEQSPPAGNWTKHAIFIADRGKNFSTSEEQEWRDTNSAGRDHMKIPPHTQRTMNYWGDYCGSTPAGCTLPKSNLLRADIKSAVNGTDGFSDGAAMLQYTGHGSFTVWSDDVFFAHGFNGLLDVDGLNNGARLPWVIAHNCLTGGFMDVSNISLGEAWLKRANGGSIAVFAPSGLTDTYYGLDVTDKIWGDLYGAAKERVLGNAVGIATTFVCLQGGAQACQNYTLLGDPSVRMNLPTVAPATSVTATGANGVVNLAWTASATPLAKYDIWRAEFSPTTGYTRINGDTPFVGTAYADTTVQNARTYFYYVVALDAALFESRVSHFNSDCAISGPDCLKATPLNPNPPPAPVVQLVDTEIGGRLGASWPAPAPDIDFYTVKWGTTQGGPYPFSANAGRMTSYSITGLTNGLTYYVVVTATNTSDLSSSSLEKAAVPTFVRGVRAPDVITTVHVNKAGPDLQLTWNAVTADIYAKPTTVSTYEVFRGTTPTFTPGPGNKIGQTAGTTFPDPGANSIAAPAYHYLVRAVDAAGNVGGLGNQLPNGIDVITLSKTPNGLGGYTIGISWSPVTTDFDGQPLAIDHYEVYAASFKFTRTDVRNGIVPLVASPVTASWSETAPAANRYYSVIAVDDRGNKSPF
jgi:hypothetical protein